MIPDSFIEELRIRTDINDLIGSYVQLKRSGRNLSGLCPFHSERSPSFVVYNDTQSFYCFGCGAGGDIITFTKMIENLDYVEALKFLAQRAGLQIPEANVDDREARLRMRALEVNRATAKFYHSSLMSPSAKEAQDYLINRGLNKKTITKFGIGYAPDSWDSLYKHLLSEGFSLNEMVAATVVAVNKKGNGYDSLRNRIVFPIIDVRGNVIGFGGRALGDQTPKYLNSSDSVVFKKSRNLYSLNIAKATKEKYFLLAEGYMDVVSVVQGGFDNVVATLGTALTEEQARLITRYVDEVVICYDSDEAGQKATARATQLLKSAGVGVRVVVISGAKDPDEYIKKYGAERFRLLIEKSETSTEHKLRTLSLKYDIDNPEQKAEYLKELCSFVAELSNAIEADVYITKTARELSVSKDVLVDTVNKIKKDKKRKVENKANKDLKPYSQQIPALAKDKERLNNIKYAYAEDKIIYSLIKHSHKFLEIRSEISPEDFVTEINRGIFKLVYDRLSENLSVEMIRLSEFLDNNQIARVSWLLANYNDQSFSSEELLEFCKLLLSHKDVKTASEIREMSNDEWAEQMKKISAGKK